LLHKHKWISAFDNVVTSCKWRFKVFGP
jgi:hypothetical protein